MNKWFILTICSFICIVQNSPSMQKKIIREEINEKVIFIEITRLKGDLITYREAIRDLLDKFTSNSGKFTWGIYHTTSKEGEKAQDIYNQLEKEFLIQNAGN